MAQKPQKKNEVETTGHSWDGIEEFNNPLPKWWVWIFYICIVWGIWYTIAYPAWPLLKGATAGYLGFSTRADVQAEIDAVNKRNAAINERLATVALTDIAKDEKLLTYAKLSGDAVFKTWCAQCHGAGAAGVKRLGYPNLNDDDWLWGGKIEDIYFTIAHGIRNEDDPDEEARFSEMPAFGRDELLEPKQIDQVVNYVMTLSRETPKDATQVAAGKVVYDENCASCHGEDGKGDREQGAPNLSDRIWLYGGSFETIKKTVWDSRYGVMPNWNTRLSEAQLRAVSVYVHTRGGGEK